MEKLHEYQGWTGRFHSWRDNARLKYSSWREVHQDETIVEVAKNYARKVAAMDVGKPGEEDYSHVYR